MACDQEGCGGHCRSTVSPKIGLHAIQTTHCAPFGPCLHLSNGCLSLYHTATTSILRPFPPLNAIFEQYVALHNPFSLQAQGGSVPTYIFVLMCGSSLCSLRSPTRNTKGHNQIAAGGVSRDAKTTASPHKRFDEYRCTRSRSAPRSPPSRKQQRVTSRGKGVEECGFALRSDAFRCDMML